MHDFYFADQNGVKSTEHHIFLEQYPTIELGQEKLEKVTIPGKGNIWIPTGTYSDTEIKFTADVNVLGTNVGRFSEYMKARAYLKNMSSISFCDSEDYFYKIKYTELGKLNQYSEMAGDFEVKFLCEAGAFLKIGLQEYDRADVLENPYSESHPTYLISGEGVCALTVNGNQMIANVGQNITIDTELMIAYRIDGTMQNTSVSGGYEGLYLTSGTNVIEITDGFGVKVIPNWRQI